jgi:hypothetical protein
MLKSRDTLPIGDISIVIIKRCLRYGFLTRLRMVRKERLELSHLTILEPKSSASTNSATSAKANGGYT